MTQEIQQSLFNYLSEELGVTALQTNMQDIERIILEGRKTDIMEQITELSKEVNDGNRERGFWDNYEALKGVPSTKQAFISQMLMLVVSELSEGVEALRKDNVVTEYHKETFKKWRDNGATFKVEFEEHIKDKFEDELADAFIRILDLAGGLGIDLGFYVNNKLTYNSMRDRKHGKNF